MSRLFNRWLNDSCEIYRYTDNQVPGNTPKLKYERIPGTFPCRYEKRTASPNSTVVGDIPTTRHFLFLQPGVEIRENYRVKINGREFTVEEVVPMKRRYTIHHIEVELKARN